MAVKGLIIFGSERVKALKVPRGTSQIFLRPFYKSGVNVAGGGTAFL